MREEPLVEAIETIVAFNNVEDELTTLDILEEPIVEVIAILPEEPTLPTVSDVQTSTAVPSTGETSVPTFFVMVQLGSGKKWFRALVDTGSDRTLISDSLPLSQLAPYLMRLRAAGGHELRENAMVHCGHVVVVFAACCSVRAHCCLVIVG